MQHSINKSKVSAKSKSLESLKNLPGNLQVQLNTHHTHEGKRSEEEKLCGET